MPATLIASQKLAVMLAAMAAFTIAALFVYQAESNRLLQRKQFATAITMEYAHAIEQQFHASISSTYALAAFLRHNKGDLSDFEQIAGEILNCHQAVIQNLQLAPQGVVTRIYPLAGHEKAIGHDLFKDPKRRDDALKAVRQKALTLSGPFNLVQGGNGVIARLPVFLSQNGSPERFWGFVTALIRTDNLLKASKLDRFGELGYVYELSKMTDGQRQLIATTTAGSPPADPVTVSVNVPNAQWTLSVAPRDGWLNTWIVAVELAVAALIGLLSGKLMLSLYQRMALQKELAEINATLEARIAQEVSDSRAKDLVLIQQSRYAALGEMIANIAHQWRQPLNILDLLLTNIQDSYEYGELDEKSMRDYVAQGHQVAENMSKTIDDFRDFFRPNKEKQAFSLRQAVDSALSILSASLKNHGIAVELDIPQDVEAWGYPNEFGQVLVNLFNNAREAIREHRPNGGRIILAVRATGEWAEVFLRDNGGGIKEEILSRVFEPYFTTKKQGTGIGLYMSRMIVVDSMGGSLSAANRGEGAEFLVRIPLGKTQHPG